MQEWAIGDVHGCGRTLEKLIEKIAPTAGDHLIFIGDLIDRGPNHRLIIECITQLQHKNVKLTFIRGNHEQGFLNALAEKDVPVKKNWLGRTIYDRPHTKSWETWGGIQFLKEYGVSLPEHLPQTWAQLAESSIFYLETDICYLVHAGFNFKHPCPFEDTESMMWVRQFTTDLAKTGGKIVIHGHVPVHEDLIRLTADAEPEEFGFIDIDNGAVYAGRPGLGHLVALEISSRKLIFQPCLDLVT